MDSKTKVLLDKWVSDLDFSVRTISGLRANKITFIKDLVVLKYKDIRRFRNIGKHSLHDIESNLASVGLHLEMDLSKIEPIEHTAPPFKKEYNLNTPLWQLTVGEFLEILNAETKS